MTRRPSNGKSRVVLTAATAGVLALLALPAAGLAQGASGGVPCPLTAAEVSMIVGKPVQRVSLGDPGGDRLAQCAFAPVGKVSGRPLPSPQVFLTLNPGDATDLRDLATYYAKSRTRLATRPQLESRPDLGPGAFTLSSTTSPVVTAFFLAGRVGVGTLVVDLTDAAVGKRDLAIADKVFSLVRSRLK